MTQTESGKAFEYQLALELSKFLNIPFLPTPEKTIVQHYRIFGMG